jgi:hypothetical protein
MMSSHGLPLNSWLGDNSARLVFVSITHYAETGIYIGVVIMLPTEPQY